MPKMPTYLTVCQENIKMNNEMQNQEALSALADGQLEAEAFASTAEQLLTSTQFRAAWHSYHLIGDVMRSTELAHCKDDAAFVARFRARLDNEPQRPVSAVAEVDAPIAADFAGRATAAANAPWKWLAVAASVVAVGAIGWNMLALGISGGASVQLSQSPVPGLVQVTAGNSSGSVMLRDARLDELLAAHKQMGGTSALQMPAGFLRNATFDSGAAANGH